MWSPRPDSAVIADALQASVTRLRVWHWPKPGQAHRPTAVENNRLFSLQTCLREILVAADDIESAGRTAELYRGADAFQLLLEIASGLHSAIPGETNVFGQFKRAWAAFRESGAPDVLDALAPAFGQILRDTRRIRRAHLEGAGGASYGSLVRRLLRPSAGDRLLIVGAGHLARSLIRFFRTFETGVWSRRAPDAFFNAACRRFAQGEERAAADWADHVILTTPPDATNDSLWESHLGECAATSIVHLGHWTRTTLRWGAALRVGTLEEVFALQQAQANIRSLRIERARLACSHAADKFRGPVDRASDCRAFG